MALTLTQHIFKAQNALGEKVQTTAAAILGLLTGASVKSLYEAEDNTNAFTDAEKTKLAALDPNHFRGTFLNLAALQAITGVAGDYGDVDAGAGNDVERYIWDANDNEWVVQSGEVTAETAATVKAKYESNPDTNALTDAGLAKLDNITVSDPINLDTEKVATAENTAARHAAVSLAANTGFVLTGQEISNDYAALPPA